MNHNLKLKDSQGNYSIRKKRNSHTVEGRAGNQGMKRRNADYPKYRLFR